MTLQCFMVLKQFSGIVNDKKRGSSFAYGHCSAMVMQKRKLVNHILRVKSVDTLTIPIQ